MTVRKGGLQIPPDKSTGLGFFKQPVVSTRFLLRGRSVVHFKRNLTQKICSIQRNYNVSTKKSTDVRKQSPRPQLNLLDAAGL